MVTTALERSVKLSMYRDMQLVRSFERRVYELFLSGGVAATSHLSTGMEAVAAGFAAATRSVDLMFCSYRGHAHVLARGASMEAMFGELLGRSNGLMRGKGGSMHLTSVSHGAFGSYAIVGAHLPIAVGAAWSAQARGSEQVVLCFFGDGATNIGAFHEALNMASVWKVPVIFVCENNLYMEYTLTSTVTSVANPAADRAAAYGFEQIVVDGNDVEAVFEVASAVVEQARSGGGPALIEAQTYRQCGHSNSDPAKYRPDGELKWWMDRDPVDLFRSKLLASGIGFSELDAIDEEIATEVLAASAVAEAAPLTTAEHGLTNVWADGGFQWRR
jgi:pyruvate dehydrogenase E1 component alpha subunit